LTATQKEYVSRLVSLVIFGSLARGAATPESDIDMLIIAENLPLGRMNRVAVFDRIEEEVREKNPENAHFEISPIFKTPEEVRRGSPLFWDMTDHVIILHDREEFFKNYLVDLKKRLDALGARRVVRGNAWYWILKDHFTPGEVFEI
jgi:predicted nucleotidyltransferase